MQLCAKNKNWKLEKTSKRYYIRFYGRPWYRNVVEYGLDYFFVFVLIPILLCKIMPMILGIERIAGFILLTVLTVGGIVLWKFNTEFQFAVVRLNFKDKFMAFSHTDSVPYKTLRFDIEKTGRLYRLFLFNPNAAFNKNGNTFSVNDCVDDITLLKLNIWESDILEEVEHVQQLLVKAYEEHKR